MRVIDVQPINGELVEFDNSEPPYIYTRYGTDSWTAHYGESEESVYYCEELEAAYQAFVEGIKARQ